MRHGDSVLPSHMTPYTNLMGFAALSRILGSGVTFSELGPLLEARVAINPLDTSALMDIATLLFFTNEPANRAIALDYQRRALQLTQVYKVARSEGRKKIRLLVIMAPGDMTANNPVDCLLEDSDIDMTLLYLVPGTRLPCELPAHDLIFVAIGESLDNRPLLTQASNLARLSPRSVINLPDRIAALTRENVCSMLRNEPGTSMPATVKVDREKLSTGDFGLDESTEFSGIGGFPILVRPLDSHGGKNLSKIKDAGSLSKYLAVLPDEHFYVSQFVDYQSADHQFRKYRITLIDGVPYPSHLAISSNWMIHYFNADMAGSQAKRNEEARFFANFETGFRARHENALRRIDKLVGLELVSIDCAETLGGKLLIFEIDNAAIVHALDDPAVFPYKPPAMQKLFTAFRGLLQDRANRV